MCVCVCVCVCVSPFYTYTKTSHFLSARLYTNFTHRLPPTLPSRDCISILPMAMCIFHDTHAEYR